MYAGTSYDIFSVKFIDLNDTVWSNAGLSLPQAKPSFLILDFLNVGTSLSVSSVKIR